MMKISLLIKQIVALVAAIALAYPATSQGLEIGGGLGMSQVTGDISKSLELAEVGFAGQAFVRYNLSNVVSARATGMVASVRGADATNPIDPFTQLRDADFSRIILEVSGVIEYNFLDYKERNSLINWSPYFFGGFGLSAFTNKREGDDYSRIQPVIPFGLGVKYRLNKQWNLEFEFGARKTFFDRIDRISDHPFPNKITPNYGNELDNDWYYFTGFSISYTFYSVPCPFDYN